MATSNIIAERCAFTSAGLASMGSSPEWDARVTVYLRCYMLANAECDFGSLARATEASSLEHMRIEERHGPGWRSMPKARAECAATSKAAIAAERKWTEQYCEPYWQAARDLALTPAPTLAAAMFKVRVIEMDELDNDSKMPRDCFEIVAEDMARLGGDGTGDHSGT